MAPRKDIRVLLYGMSGVGKTHFVRSFPKPMLVLQFDPEDKATPYYRLGTVVDVVDPFFAERRLQVKHVVDKDGKVLVRIELYRDDNPETPMAYQAFKARVAELWQEAKNPWETIVLDSITAMEAAFMDYNKYSLNKNYKEPRLHFADLGNEMRGQGLRRFPSLKCNVVWIAHTSEKDKETGEGMRRGVSAVGQLKQLLPSQFGEVYFAYVEKDKEGNRRRFLRTQTDGEFEAATQIGVPDGCEMDYEKLWSEWEKS